MVPYGGQNDDEALFGYEDAWDSWASETDPEKRELLEA